MAAGKKVTSKPAASAAGRNLNKAGASKDCKTASGSALSQRESRGKKK